jgi:hypothetical protein
LNPKFLSSKAEGSLQISVTNNTSKSIHMEKQNRNKVFPPAFPNLAHFSRESNTYCEQRSGENLFCKFQSKIIRPNNPEPSFLPTLS